jgi:hypothetical protein
VPKARKLFDIGQPLQCKPTAYRKDVRSSPGEISTMYGWLRVPDPEAGCCRLAADGILETSAGPCFKFLLICLGDSRSAFINHICSNCRDPDCTQA